VNRHAGDLRVLITATNSFVTAPIARLFGIEHLIATDPEQSDGRFTGAVAGIPCFREGKVERLAAWLKLQGRALETFGKSWFYSDSLNDLPLLERVTDPVAVDPDDTLRAHATRHGWPVITLAS
jgi:HAD superfamily hydrolase (TIGR01490 family)